MSKNHKAENPMRAKEVQQMLGIGKNTLYSWCAKKLIPYKRVGRVILFPPRKRILEWLENKNEGGFYERTHS